MGSPSLPEQPEAPDYAKANQEAIFSDIQTLPTRRKIDQAARLGQLVEYTDPRSGQTVTADFRGLGDLSYGQAAADLALSTNDRLQRGQLALRQERVFDPKAYAAANKDVVDFWNANRASLMDPNNKDPLAARTLEDFLQKHWETAGRKEGRQGGENGVTLGEANAMQTAAEIRAADPLAYEARQKLTGQLLGDLNAPDEVIGPNGALMAAASAIQTQKRDPRIGNLYDEAIDVYATDVTDSSTDALNVGLAQALEEYKLGGKLDDGTRRELTDSVRASQAARGNILGDAATQVEALEVGSAAEARKQQRLAQLLGVQAQAFGQNTQLRADKLNALNSRFGTLQALQGQDFNQDQARLGNALNAAQAGAAEERAARGETFGRKQQKYANASSFVLGMPVTNQFGSLGGAQQGAVGFAPISGAAAPTLNPNAGAQGAQFAQGNYGTAAGMWGQSAQIAAQGSPWMGLLGNVVGGVAGGVGAGLGGGLAKMI